MALAKGRGIWGTFKDQSQDLDISSCYWLTANTQPLKRPIHHSITDSWLTIGFFCKRFLLKTSHCAYAKWDRPQILARQARPAHFETVTKCLRVASLKSLARQVWSSETDLDSLSHYACSLTVFTLHISNLFHAKLLMVRCQWIDRSKQSGAFALAKRRSENFNGSSMLWLSNHLTLNLWTESVRCIDQSAN